MVAESTSGRISRDQRFTRRNPCPICTGGDDDKRGRGIRCYGFLSEDEQWAHCTNSDYAGALSQNLRTGAYVHKLSGPCRCGEEHGAAPIVKRAIPQTPEPVRRSHLKRKPDEIYNYRALETGEPIRKLRYGYGKDKSTPWQVPDGKGDWRNCSGDRPTPDAYRAETLAAADPFEPLAITEGEKDADKLARLGWRLVLSPPDGTGSWRDEYSVYAAGRQVVIFADKDTDGKGQDHAQRVAASVAPHAVSVRVVLFEDAHDVGDWIDAGGGLEDLRRIAAAAPTIAARQPQTLNSSFTPQDDHTPSTLKTCPACQPWKERAVKAEAKLDELYRERAWENHVEDIPCEILSAPVKMAALAVNRELRDGRHKERDTEGRPRIFRAAIAQRLGVGEKAVSGYLKKLDAVGLFTRIEKRSLDDTALYIAPGPNHATPAAIQAPERGNTWGGARPKTCKACGSDNLETRVVCRDCGALFSSEDTNKPRQEDSEEPETLNSTFTPQDDSSDATSETSDATPEGAPQPQPATQDNTPPLIRLVGHLENMAQGEDLPPLPLPTLRNQLITALNAAPHGWRSVVQLKDGRTGGDRQTWEAFIVNNDAARLNVALIALRAQTMPPSTASA